VCTGYRKKEEGRMHTVPASVRELEACVPHYVVMPGWSEDIRDATSFDELPKNAKDYVTYIKALLGGTHLTYIGVGEGRKQLLRRNP